MARFCASGLLNSDGHVTLTNLTPMITVFEREDATSEKLCHRSVWLKGNVCISHRVPEDTENGELATLKSHLLHYEAA